MPLTPVNGADRPMRLFPLRLFPLRLFMRAVAILCLVGLGACVGDLTEVSKPIAPRVSEDGETRVLAPSEIVIAMEPFTGAPGNVLDPLARRIVSQAKREGLRITRRRNATAPYRMIGKFTSVGDLTRSTVIYVYEIYDASGRLVHRIHGQEIAGGSSGDPWTGFSGDAVSNVANRSVEALKAWVYSLS